jgi:hypothetical protein
MTLRAAFGNYEKSHYSAHQRCYSSFFQSVVLLLHRFLLTFMGGFAITGTRIIIYEVKIVQQFANI